MIPEDIQVAIDLITAPGQYPPTEMIINGGVLNQLLKASEYDENKAYLVTAEGISELDL